MSKFVCSKDRIRYKRFVFVLCIISIMITVIYSYCYYKNDIPKNITILVDEVSSFKSNIPITANFNRTANSLALVSGDGIKSGYTYCGIITLKRSNVDNLRNAYEKKLAK